MTIPPASHTNKSLQDALDWACQLGRERGGWGAVVRLSPQVATPAAQVAPVRRTMSQIKYEAVLDVLERHGWQKNKAAAELRINRNTLDYILKNKGDLDHASLRAPRNIVPMVRAAAAAILLLVMVGCQVPQPQPQQARVDARPTLPPPVAPQAREDTRRTLPLPPTPQARESNRPTIPPMPVARGAETETAGQASAVSAPATNGMVILRWEAAGTVEVWRDGRKLFATAADNATVKGLTVGTASAYYVNATNVWASGMVGQALQVAWDASPDPVVTGYRVHHGPASRDYEFAQDVGSALTATLALGAGRNFLAATAYDAKGIDSDFSNEVFFDVPLVAVAQRPGAWQWPKPTAYAWRYSWPAFPGVTNVLEGSNDLRQWQTVARFRGSAAAAGVTVTNGAAFHRVKLESPTNSPRFAITQTVAYVRLTWNGDGRPKVLEREIDPAAGAFTRILTNSGSGLVSAILPAAAGSYRVSEP